MDAAVHKSPSPWTAILLQCLTSREREVVNLREGNLTWREIGAQFGVSTERARQIHDKAAQRLVRIAERAIAVTQRRGAGEHIPSCRIKHTRCLVAEADLEVLNQSVDVLEPSVRAENCLTNAGCKYVGDLIQLTEAQALKVKNLGRHTLRELREALAQLGLHLDMDVTGWVRPGGE